MVDTSAIQKLLLKKIAEAIRVKTGVTRKIKVTEFPELIRSIDNGGGSETIDIYTLQLLLGKDLITNSVIENIVIPEGIESIQYGTFERLKTIKSITFPSTLKYMRGSSSMFSSDSSLEEITFLGDWNSNISLPSYSSSVPPIKKVYCHSWFYDNFKNSSSNAYIRDRLECLHDSDLTELLFNGLVTNIYQRGETCQLEIEYNQYDCAYDEQRGVTWEVIGEGVTITQTGFLEVSEDAVYGTPFKIRCTSNYNSSIFVEEECLLLEKIVIYNRGEEDERYKLTNQTPWKASITRNSSYMTVSTSSGVYADVTTLNKVDLTFHKIVRFYGKINSTNSENGYVFITDNPTVKHSSANRVREVKLLSSLTYYDIDISDLDGEYYIGFAGSNRTVTCYELVVI